MTSLAIGTGICDVPIIGVSTPKNTNRAATGYVRLTGQDANVVYGRLPFALAQGSFTLTGQAAGQLRTYVGTNASGTFALTGFDANLGQTAKTQVCDVAFVSLTGFDANQLRTYAQPSAQGAFVLTGYAANLNYGGSGAYSMLAAMGSLTLTGQDAGQIWGHNPSVNAQGSVTLTGQSANMLYGRVSSNTVGTFALTGDAMTPTVNYIFPLAQGALALTGQAAGQLRTYVSTNAQGSVTLAGQNATLTYSAAPTSTYTLTAAVGTFALTGQAANQPRTYVQPNAQGSAALAGQAATLTYSGAGGGDAAWTTAFVARTSGLSGPQTTAVKTFMNTLATAGLDAKCEFAHILALPGTNWTLNLKSTSYTAVNHGATHTDLLGIIGDGTAAYVDTGCTPSSGLTVASVNSHSLFYAQSNLDNDNGPSMCIDSLNAHNYVTSSDFGSDFVATIAKGTSLSWANPDTVGATAYFGTSRTSSTATALYHNGTSVATSSTGAADSVFDSGALQYLGGANLSFAISTLGFGAMFSGLNATEHGTLQTAVQTLLHALNSTAYP